MIYNDRGTMTVATSSASGAYPIEGVVVRIRGASEENRFEEYTVLTDRDGLTPEISLIAPAKIYSESPNANEPPYALYDVEISKEGYYSKYIYNVSVFSGVNSFLPVNMIPVDKSSTIPMGNLTTNVTQDLQ